MRPKNQSGYVPKNTIEFIKIGNAGEKKKLADVTKGQRGLVKEILKDYMNIKMGGKIFKNHVNPKIVIKILYVNYVKNKRFSK